MSQLLVSDQDREYTIGLLRDHCLSGRLTTDEFEERVGEACGARYSTDLWHALRWLPVELRQPPRRGSATPALILSVLGWCVLVFTLGFGSPLALPLFAVGWVAGREARRSSPGSSGAAAAAEAFAITGTLACLLFIAGCAAIVAGA